MEGGGRGGGGSKIESINEREKWSLGIHTRTPESQLVWGIKEHAGDLQCVSYKVRLPDINVGWKHDPKRFDSYGLGPSIDSCNAQRYAPRACRRRHKHQMTPHTAPWEGICGQGPITNASNHASQNPRQTPPLTRIRRRVLMQRGPT